MSERALKKLRRDARDKEFERKTKVAKKEQMEREKMEQVHLTWAIYIEPIASWELIKE